MSNKDKRISTLEKAAEKNSVPVMFFLFDKVMIISIEEGESCTVVFYKRAT